MGSSMDGAYRSDAAVVARLIERVRLLVAVSDEVPIETKLNCQALLKMFENAVDGAEADATREAQAAGYFKRMYADLEPYGDLEALLSAMKVFLPYL